MMAEPRLRKTSSEEHHRCSITSIGSTSSARATIRVSESPSQTAVPEEELELTVVRITTKPPAPPPPTPISPPVYFGTPQTKPKVTRAKPPQKPPGARLHIKAEGRGSKAFENYTNTILERAKTNESVAEHASSNALVAGFYDGNATSSLLKPPRPFERRRSWNDKMDLPSDERPVGYSGQRKGSVDGGQARATVEDSPFKRQSRARSSWTAGKSSQQQQAENDESGLRSSFRKPLTRFGRLLVGKGKDLS